MLTLFDAHTSLPSIEMITSLELLIRFTGIEST
ncbi:unnamed protein product [Haemonchus placei]|uniref:Transposase n=1 Tax=Haemonchus placei TaxID=6290 RepID=A0A0N4X8W4_HAEPC|nr:unnamed protein product [Haemonchus placei]